jgi:alanyl aminopeptidase
VTSKREEAAMLLSKVAEDPSTRKALASLGLAYLPEVAGPPHPDAIEPSLLALALTESLRSDPARITAVIVRLETEQDPTLRRALLTALGEQEAEPLAARIRELTIEPRLRTNEVFDPLGGELRKRQTRELAWTWFVGHYHQVLKRLPDEDRTFLPELALGFCSHEDARDVEAFFTPHLPDLTGADRTLKQTTETIRLCAAHVASQRESAREYFTSH